MFYKRSCCEVFSGRRCTAALTFYSTGTTCLSRKGLQEEFAVKFPVGNKEERISYLYNGGRRFFTGSGAPLCYSNRSPSKRTTTEAYPWILAVIIYFPSRYSELPAYQDMKIWTDYLPLL